MLGARLTILDRSKSDFLNLISHEFRTPLNGILGVGELILGSMPATQENNGLQELHERCRLRLISMLDDAMLLTQIDVTGEHLSTAKVSLSVVLERAIEEATEFAESRSVTFVSPVAGIDFILGDEDLLIRALRALLETAVRFSKEGETVRVLSDVGRDSPSILIESAGKAVPSSSIAKLFEIFAVSEVETPGGNLGLGPALAYRILSLFGGSVSVANRDPSGIRLTVSLINASPQSGKPLLLSFVPETISVGQENHPLEQRHSSR